MILGNDDAFVFNRTILRAFTPEPRKLAGMRRQYRRSKSISGPLPDKAHIMTAVTRYDIKRTGIYYEGRRSADHDFQQPAAPVILLVQTGTDGTCSCLT